MNFNIKPSLLKNEHSTINNNNNTKNLENVLSFKILSAYTYNNLKNNLDYLPIKDDISESYSVGNIAIFETFERFENKSPKEGDEVDIFENKRKVNYSKETIIITDFESQHLALTKLYYRPIITLSQLKNGSYVAGVPNRDFSVEFKDGKWYSAFNEDNIVYCYQVYKINIDQYAYKIHIDDNRLYEKDGQVFYDNPKPLSEMTLPDWCHI